MGTGVGSQRISEMKKNIPPANYDLVEINKPTDVMPRGSSFAIFFEGMYDLNDIVSSMWGDERATVYFKIHTFKNRQSKCFYIPYPPKKETPIENNKPKSKSKSHRN
jgi:hypothetical protein